MGENFIALSEDFMPQNYAYSAIMHETQGGGCPPPRFLCVMMSKKEIYE